MPASMAERPTDFVCEEDVRQALRHGKKITVGDRTIVTPAARDLGQEHKIFISVGIQPRV
jgi:ethanolamine utilization cobalamin adenosyltransferase